MMLSAISFTVSVQIVTLNCQVEMIGQSAGRREKFLKRRPLGDFAFLRLAAISAGIEILIEERAHIEFVKRIGLRLFRNLFRFRFQKVFVAVIVGWVGSSLNSSRTGLAIIS